MTREERVEKLRHLIKCLKCDVSGKPCDVNCPTQYSAGNMGEIIENLEEIAKVLDQELCDDAVSRAAVDHLCFEFLKVNSDNNIAFYEHFRDLPSVTPARKKGKWLSAEEYALKIGAEVTEDIKNSLYKFCPFCEQTVFTERNYCPNCGADMRGEEV